MTPRDYRAYILTTTAIPPLGLLIAAILLWNDLFGWLDLGLLVGFYILSLIGLTVGYHRLFTHRSFKTSRPLRIALGIMGASAAEGPPITWVAHHRKHHATADHEGDPHSPHLHPEPGLMGTLRGLWHAHAGWLFDLSLTSDPMRYAPDMVRDQDMAWISKHFIAIAVAGVIAPGLIGFAVTGTLLGGLTGMVWGGLVRIFLVHHMTYSVASIGHYFGPRSFETKDESRNVALLAIPSFGDSWHNNHHAFPTSARHGLRWWQVDLAGLIIQGLARLGLAWDVVAVSPERIRSKAIDAPGQELGRSAGRPLAGS